MYALTQCHNRYIALNLTRKKVKSNYFTVRPKVDLLSLPHLGIFAIHTR